MAATPCESPLLNSWAYIGLSNLEHRIHCFDYYDRQGCFEHYVSWEGALTIRCHQDSEEYVIRWHGDPVVAIQALVNLNPPFRPWTIATPLGIKIERDLYFVFASPDDATIAMMILP